jgi:hypothetical protein
MSAPFRVKRRTFSARRQPPALSLNDAMLSVVGEDLRASPCVVCDQPGPCIGLWSPTAEVIANDLGGDPSRSRQIAYRLCGACADPTECTHGN